MSNDKSHPFEEPTFDEAPLVALIEQNLDNMDETALRVHLQKIRELRQVPQKRKAATSGKKAKLQDDISHLLD